ncbi:MAG: transposase [Bacillota bacterium]|nr:transposase [Bacillota bacterium]
MSILISIFLSGYHGKTTDFAKNSSCHRTTIAHFLNSGKWDDSLLSDTLKKSVIEIIYSEAARTGKPVFCIVDDTIASKTKPSSRALHPIEDAYFHQSHLKGKQDYGHQAVSVMLSCNGIVLNYAFVMYDKSISKIEIVQNIAKELPVPPVMSYFLCDCWYVSEKIINTFATNGFHTIGALKTNRMLFPFGLKKKLSEFAALLSVACSDFHLVTVQNRKYYVYRYEGKLNGIENAVVLLSYPKKSFGNPKALRAFLSTDISLSTDDILSYYVCRWAIEVFFRQCKSKLALDSYQIRSSKGIRRFWLLMSLAHYLCVAGNGKCCSFESGYHKICDIIKLEKYHYLFLCAKESNDFNAFMKLAV